MKIDSDGNVGIFTNTASTATNTGALTVAGGVGIAGTLNVPTLNVSTLGKFARISVHSNGTTDVNNAYRISARATSNTTGAILGYASLANDTIFGILGFQDAYSFYGNGTLFNSGALNNTGAITATTTITPGTCTNGSAAKSYILTAAPTTTSMPVPGSVAYIV
jgi:hypothetical protein